MKYLLKYYYVIWAGFLTFGIYLGKRFVSSLNINLLLVIIIIILSLISILFISKKITDSYNIRLTIIISVFIFALLGYVSSSIYYSSQKNNIFNKLNNSYASIEGMIANYPKFKGNIQYFELKTFKTELNTENIDSNNYLKTSDVLEVWLKTDYQHLFKRDDFIEISGDLTIKNDEPVLISKSFNIKKIQGVSCLWRIFDLRSKIYRCLRNVYYKNMDFDYASISEALILGNTANIRDYIVTNFKNSGVYHLLAISGLHISFFIYIIITCFRRLIYGNINNAACLKTAGLFKNNAHLKKALLFILILTFLFMYNFIIGERASALRATIMALFVNLAIAFNREYSSKIVLCFAYIFMLIFMPSFFNDAGFWLSFASMAGIVFINKIVVSFLNKFFSKFNKNKKYNFKIENNYAVRLVIMTVSINIFIFPIMAFLFGSFSTVSIIANILVIPVFYLLLLILIISSISALMWPPIGGIFIKSSAFLFLYILKITELLGSSKFSIMRFERFTEGCMLIYYFVLFILLFLMNRYAENKN
jgi:ComEC/Rec2-related protein